MAKDSAGRKMPWFKFWPRDFMADPVVQAMSFDKRGRFLWALLCSWETDTPGIASEEQWRKWLGYSQDGWEANHLDFPIGPGDMGSLLVQKRLLYEFQQIRQEVERKSSAGVAGAKARWDQDAVAMRRQCGGNGNPPEGRRQIAEETKPTSARSDVSVADASPRVFELPLRDGTTYGISEADVVRWKKFYPDVLILETLREQAAWLDSNPERRKTRRGMKRFINGWFLKEQNTPPKEDAYGSRKG